MKKLKEKIVLTQDEIIAMEKLLNGEIGLIPKTEKDMRDASSVIRKAMAAMHELDAAEESGDDTILWFKNLYYSQQ